MNNKVFVLFLLIIATFPAWSQEASFDTSFSVDWARGEIYSQVSFDLAQAGIRLPAGRFLAEETLRDAYPQLLRPQLLSLRLDSNSTVGNLVERGELSLAQLDSICLEAEKIPPVCHRI
jgi:hypothetical protein